MKPIIIDDMHCRAVSGLVGRIGSSSKAQRTAFSQKKITSRKRYAGSVR